MMLSTDKIFKDRCKVSLVCLTNVTDVTRLSVKPLTF